MSDRIGMAEDLSKLWMNFFISEEESLEVEVQDQALDVIVARVNLVWWESLWWIGLSAKRSLNQGMEANRDRIFQSGGGKSILAGV